MKSAVEISALTQVYPNGVAALNHIDLQIAQGDFFGLLGPNGAGKSTAINILTSLLMPSSGEVHIFGYNLATQRERAKCLIGTVPQEFNFSVFETVTNIILNQAGFYGIPRKESKERLAHWLKRLGLWEKRDATAKSLSGGMKRRLMIARALLHKPRLLILDEPTAGVDIELRQDLWHFLKELNAEGTTIILTTHYLEEAESLCKHIAIMNEGHIIKQFPTEDLSHALSWQTYLCDLREPCVELPYITAHLQAHLKCQRLSSHQLECQLSSEIAINDLLSWCSEHDLELISIRQKRNRLEDLFLRLIHQEVTP